MAAAPRPHDIGFTKDLWVLRVGGVRTGISKRCPAPFFFEPPAEATLDLRFIANALFEITTTSVRCSVHVVELRLSCLAGERCAVHRELRMDVDEQTVSPG